MPSVPPNEPPRLAGRPRPPKTATAAAAVFLLLVSPAAVPASNAVFASAFAPPSVLPATAATTTTRSLRRSIAPASSSSPPRRRRSRSVVAATTSDGDIGSGGSGGGSEATSTAAPAARTPTPPPSSTAVGEPPPSAKEESTSPGEEDATDFGSVVLSELREVLECVGIVFGSLTAPDATATPESIARLCDDVEEEASASSFASASEGSPPSASLVSRLDLRAKALKFARYESLCKLMREDYDSYVTTASFLSPNRIPREELPNVQDVPYPDVVVEAAGASVGEDGGAPLVADCTLDDVAFEDSILDDVLLKIFRNLVTENTGGVTSSKKGIDGLVEQGRTYLLQEHQTPEAQHRMVQKTLSGLMTPVLPPFYRIFMSGIVPSNLGTKYDGKQIGPWFYAPFLTSFVTPTFFKFLVGPSRVNRRKDGRPGGLVVEKCKFLQVSGCKGLCLHQCKLPAQQFFKEDLGLDLTVSPNFVTQECQWSFGEAPLPPKDDPSFPRGCLVGCESRTAVAAMGGGEGSGGAADLCN